eukprot:3627249-Amphidinium_carterae.3
MSCQCSDNYMLALASLGPLEVNHDNVMKRINSHVEFHPLKGSEGKAAICNGQAQGLCSWVAHPLQGRYRHRSRRGELSPPLPVLRASLISHAQAYARSVCTCSEEVQEVKVQTKLIRLSVSLLS